MKLIRWLLKKLIRQDVSPEWLRAQDRTDWTAGYEGVNWKWPIKK